MQESGEMYLETIHILSQQKETVRAVDVAEYMGYSKPSVSRALAILKTEGHVTIQRNGALILSETGLAVAEKIYEHHIMMAELLKQLGVTPEIADRDACRIEHVVSDETFDAIKNYIITKQ